MSLTERSERERASYIHAEEGSHVESCATAHGAICCQVAEQPRVERGVLKVGAEIWGEAGQKSRTFDVVCT